MGAQPSGPVKSMDFRVFRPHRLLSPAPPPRQISDYAPDFSPLLQIVVQQGGSGIRRIFEAGIEGWGCIVSLRTFSKVHRTTWREKRFDVF